MGLNRLITKEQSEALKVNKFLGDEALHKLEKPQKEELKSAIELIENTMFTLYVVPEKHKLLKNKLTQRVLSISDKKK